MNSVLELLMRFSDVLGSTKKTLRALKACGQVPKSLFILQFIDDPVLRQATEKHLDRIEHVHRFTHASRIGPVAPLTPRQLRERYSLQILRLELWPPCRESAKSPVLTYHFFDVVSDIKRTEGPYEFATAIGRNHGHDIQVMAKELQASG
jgi:hypothetical protein